MQCKMLCLLPLSCCWWACPAVGDSPLDLGFLLGGSNDKDRSMLGHLVYLHFGKYPFGGRLLQPTSKLHLVFRVQGWRFRVSSSTFFRSSFAYILFVFQNFRITMSCINPKPEALSPKPKPFWSQACPSCRAGTPTLNPSLTQPQTLHP